MKRQHFNYFVLISPLGAPVFRPTQSSVVRQALIYNLASSCYGSRVFLKKRASKHAPRPSGRTGRLFYDKESDALVFRPVQSSVVKHKRCYIISRIDVTNHESFLTKGLQYTYLSLAVEQGVFLRQRIQRTLTKGLTK